MSTADVERHPSDGWLVVPFETPQAFQTWMDANHASERGVWVKFAKKGRGVPSITVDEALEVALCYGWIDSKMHSLDETYYILRYQPRRRRSPWSARNKGKVERLTAEGRMRPPGLAEVEAAKADGRWDVS